MAVRAPVTETPQNEPRRPSDEIHTVGEGPEPVRVPRSAGAAEIFHNILAYSIRQDVSDIHLRDGKAPLFRKDGRLLTNKALPALPAEFFRDILQMMMLPEQREALRRDREADFAYQLDELGRFRVSVFLQQGKFAMVLRHIRSVVTPLSSLHLPQVVEGIAELGRGLVLVTGATGSGKSTTLAGIVQHINARRRCHVVTIEDPIEFLYTEEKAHISQRQVGQDTRTFASALRSALRQDPDVILVGEMRDRETVETALHAAETGHLVLSTLHTLDARETISRIINLFPPDQGHLVRSVLATTLRAVISQRLVRHKSGRGRVPAAEILIQTERIQGLIAEPSRTHEITTAIEEGHSAYASQTFDQSLLGLLRSGLITEEEALANATRVSDFKLKLSGIGRN